MSAQIIQLCPPQTADEAWAIYAALCRVEAAEPALAKDRDFLALRRKKHEDFKRLFGERA